jgi:hypothetical protein
MIRQHRWKMKRSGRVARSVQWQAQWIELLSHYSTKSVVQSHGNVTLTMALPGAPGGTRTHDLAVVSSLLCPTELPERSGIIRNVRSSESIARCH